MLVYEVAFKENLFPERQVVVFDVLAVEPRQDQELLALPNFIVFAFIVVVQKIQHWQWGI